MQNAGMLQGLLAALTEHGIALIDAAQCPRSWVTDGPVVAHASCPLGQAGQANRHRGIKFVLVRLLRS